MSKRPPGTRGGVSAVVPSAPSTAAVSRLVERNLRLVASFVHRFQHCGLPIVDLIHAGNMGLVEAARRFDASREPSFVGYASWWVRQAMIHAISDRQGAPMLSPSVVATPAVDPAALPLSSDIGEIVDELEYAAADDDVNLDETFDEIQLRASGTPRLVDRLRSQLN